MVIVQSIELLCLVPAPMTNLKIDETDEADAADFFFGLRGRIAAGKPAMQQGYPWRHHPPLHPQRHFALSEESVGIRLIRFQIVLDAAPHERVAFHAKHTKAVPALCEVSADLTHPVSSRAAPGPAPMTNGKTDETDETDAADFFSWAAG